jgi:hypothetical protein
MRALGLFLTLLFFVSPHPIFMEWRSSPQMQSNAGPEVTIESPIDDQELHGSVVIHGNVSLVEFLSYEVDFSYSQDSSRTWFLIQESDIPVQDGILAVWDTATITDGEYSLRLVVSQADGTRIEVIIDNLRVSNYTPVERDTDSPVTTIAAQAEPTTSSAPRTSTTSTIAPQPPTPTSLPANPAEISSSQMILSLGNGALIAIWIFTLLGTYLGIKAWFRNQK